MAWVAASPIEVLVRVCWFAVEVSFNFTILENDQHIKERYALVGNCLFKLDVWIK